MGNNLKWFLLLLIIVSIPLFLREQVVGTDSFYYLNIVCGIMPANQALMPLESILFSIIPCDLLVIKLLMVLLITFSLVILWFCLKTLHIDIDRVSFFIIAFGLSFVLFFFYNLENDNFGFIFGLLGIYFGLKVKSFFNPFDKNLILALFFIGIGGLIWGSTAYFLLSLLPFNAVFGIMFFIINFFINNDLTDSFTSDNLVADEVIGAGIPFIFFLIMAFLVSIVLDKKTKNNKKLLLSAVIALFIATTRAKYFIIGWPFLVLIVSFYWKNLDETIKTGFKVLGACMLVVFLYVLLTTSFPTSKDIYIVKSLENSDINNEFGLGYMMNYYDKNTLIYGGPTYENNYFRLHGVVLGWAKKAPQETCERLNSDFDNIVLYSCK